MKMAATLVTVLLLCLTTAAADPPSTETSPGMAIGTIRIDAPSEYMDHVRSLNYSAFFANVPPIHIQQTETPNSMVIRVTADFTPYDNSPLTAARAKQYLAMYTSYVSTELASAVENQRNNWQSQLAQAKDAQERIRNNMDNILPELEEQSQRIRAADPHLADLSRDSIRDLARTLETDHEAAQLDIVGKTAREKALAETIAILNTELKYKIQADPVAQQLQQVADVRQKELDAIKHAESSVVATSDELDKAVAALAEARTAVLERQEAIAKSAGADLIDQWTHEQLSLSIDLAELRAKSDATEKRLKVLSDVLHRINALPSEESVRMRFDSVNSNWHDISQQVATLRSNLDDKNLPKLTVVESHNG